jgi:methylenetetrahydrofolate reductase (NADPH)
MKYSFEVFPPKNVTQLDTLWKTLKTFDNYNPEFVSVTCGAGGSGSQSLTIDIVEKIKKETSLNVVPHLTCVGISKSDIIDILKRYKSIGVNGVLCLRGDLPSNSIANTQPHPDGYQYSYELISDTAIHFNNIFCATYPEKHPASSTIIDDIVMLKKKQDCGATCAITQFFFDIDNFLRFRDAAILHGVEIPIIPGILPINSIDGVVKFAKRCGSYVPSSIIKKYDNVVDQNSVLELSAIITTDICQKLITHGVENFHFYLLNNYRPTESVIRFLN